MACLTSDCNHMAYDKQDSFLLMYTTPDGVTKVDVTFEEDTVWLSTAQIAELFQRDRSVITKHIKNVFEEGELPRESNVQILHIAHSDKPVTFYSLDVIISVGYRVKSQRGVQFRLWAAGIIKEYMRKGFAMDDARLKELGGGGYFKELLARIRDIRASEKVFYRQVLEIYATSRPCKKLQRNTKSTKPGRSAAWSWITCFA